MKAYQLQVWDVAGHHPAGAFEISCETLPEAIETAELRGWQPYAGRSRGFGFNDDWENETENMNRFSRQRAAARAQ